GAPPGGGRPSRRTRPTAVHIIRTAEGRPRDSGAPWMSRLVEVVGLPEAPGAAWRLVPAGDVPQAPLDLGGRVVLPVRAGRGHLRAGQGLGDAVRAGAVVQAVLVPAALLVPQVDDAGDLVQAEAGL